MQLPKVSSTDDLRGICILYEKLETTTRSLKSIGITSDSYSAVISLVIMSKLPSELRLLIRRELREEWDIVGLLQRLGEEIALRAKCALSSITSTSHQIDKEWHGSKASQHQPYRKQQPTVSMLVSDNRSQQVPSCLFCINKHFSASCTKVTGPDARKRFL